MNTSIKPFTCYFCNKTIANETEQGHRSTCGSLLEPCPYKCGAYTQRRLKTKHLTECPNKVRQFSTSNGTIKRNSLESKRTQRFSMDAEQYTANSFSNFQQEEMMLLRNKVQSVEQLCKNLSQNLSFYKSKHQDTLHDQQTGQIQNKLEIEKMRYQNEMLLEWKRLIDAKIDGLRKEVLPLELVKKEIDSAIQNVTVRVSALESLRVEVSQLRDAFVKEQIYNREMMGDLSGRVNEMRDFFVQENAVLAAVWNDHKTHLDKLEDRSSTLEETIEELKARQTSATFDIRTVMNISSESSEKLELQERKLKEMEKEMKQIKFDLEVLEDASTITACTKPGRLVWKITNFKHKMDNAKENDSVLKSPIFYTDHYGYKIRLIVYLNGIKKWKGRHLIAGIHVLNGEYDALLKWPCNIEGRIILKDILEVSNPKDHSKFINAKRNEGGEENEDPQESSNQYIFIPHSTVTKQNYLKDDTIFLELKINYTNRPSDETNL